MSGYKSSELTAIRVADALRLSEKIGRSQFVGFLSEAEIGVAKNTVKSSGGNAKFWGGYSDAERVIVECSQKSSDINYKDFPITKLAFSYRFGDKLTHRDFLGSIMALGIERNTIGDIIVSDDKAVVFCNSYVAKIILQSIVKIGNVGVTVCESHDEELPDSRSLIEMSDTISSNRLDCVIASVLKKGRSAAVEFIESGLIAVDGVIIDKITLKVGTNQRVSVRGFGKFIIDDISSVTKKGRIIMKYKKFI